MTRKIISNFLREYLLLTAQITTETYINNFLLASRMHPVALQSHYSTDKELQAQYIWLRDISIYCSICIYSTSHNIIKTNDCEKHLSRIPIKKDYTSQL